VKTVKRDPSRVGTVQFKRAVSYGRAHAQGYRSNNVGRTNGGAVIRARGDEIHTCDFPTGAGPIDNKFTNDAVTFDCLNATKDGSAVWNRLGRRITMRSLHIKGFIYQKHADAGVFNDYLRILLVYDAGSNGGTPAIDDVLRDWDNAGTPTTNVFSGLNMGEVRRFRIIRDHRVAIAMQNPAFAATGDYQSLDSSDLNINWFVRLKNMETTYKANDGTRGDIATGALWLICYGLNPDGANTPNWGFQYRARLKFSK